MSPELIPLTFRTLTFMEQVGVLMYCLLIMQTNKLFLKIEGKA